MSLAVLLSVGSVGITGCGNGANTNSAPTVENGGDVDGNNDLSRYTNADWLFQNYFGDYGLPKELKEMMMPELKMLANGFALQHAQGKDVQKSISQFRTGMLMMRITGQLDNFVQTLQSGAQEDFLENDTSLENISDKNITRIISTDAKKRIERAEILIDAYKAEQKSLVDQYDLPYSLPKYQTQAIEYSSAMKSNDSKNGDGGGSSSSGSVTYFSGIDEWNWYIGDFFWVDGAYGLGHMGLVHPKTSSFGSATVIDAMPDLGVSKHYGLTNYLNDGHDWTKIEGWWYDRLSENDWTRKRIWNWAESKVGRVDYSWINNKFNRDQVYCSSFIYQAYRFRAGVNLDSTPRDSSVFPRDITDHEDVYMFNSQN